jgi:hypothetical protein
MERAPCTDTLDDFDASVAARLGLPVPASSGWCSHTRLPLRLLRSHECTHGLPSHPSIHTWPHFAPNAILRTSLREMYLNIDTVDAHEPPTASCRFCSTLVAVLYRAAPSLDSDRRRRKESACCRATAPLCFHLKRCTATKGGCSVSLRIIMHDEPCCAVACTIAPHTPALD